MSVGKHLAWIDSLSRDAPKCSKRCLDSSKEGILSIALLGIVSHNSKSSTVPMSRIITFDSSLNGL